MGDFPGMLKTMGLNVPANQEGAAALSMAGTAMNVFGNLGAGLSSVIQGRRAKAEADFEAAQMRQNAGQAIASGQRDAMSEELRTRLIISRSLAVAAASGGGVTDTGVAKILSDVSGIGAYRKGVALYQGEEKARIQNLSADAKELTGENLEMAGYQKGVAYTIGAAGAMANGASSLYAKYGKGGPRLSDAELTYGNF